MIKLPKIKLNNAGRAFVAGAKKNAPIIMVVVGVGGMGVAVYSAYKNGPKALNALEAEKNRINDERYEEAKERNYEEFEEINKLPIKDTIIVTWKYIVPTVAIFCGSAALIFGGNHIWAKRNAVLAAGYAVLDKAYQEYTSKAVEVLGPQKEQEIRQAVAEDRVKQNPVENREVIITDHGETLCYDMLSGRYFKSSRNQIDRIINILNARMRDEMFISLNELYLELDIPPVEIGNEFGWDIDNGYIEVAYDTTLASDSTPCLTMTYLVKPRSLK